MASNRVESRNSTKCLVAAFLAGLWSNCAVLLLHVWPEVGGIKSALVDITPADTDIPANPLAHHLR